MLRVGLTGNIGSGKSIVAEIFSILGVPVFHADDEARALYERQDVKNELAGILGMGIFNDKGGVDRRKMATILFSDELLVKKVNRLIHPMVREALGKFCTQHSHCPYIVYEAAILVESGYYRELDRLILVTAPEHMRIQRVVKRDSITEKEVYRRARFQLPEAEKIPLADWVIDNGGTVLVIPQVLETDRHLRLQGEH